LDVLGNGGHSSILSQWIKKLSSIGIKKAGGAIAPPAKWC